MKETCLTCGSDAPHLHPAVQYEGEVHVCRDSFHDRITAENTAKRIDAVHAAEEEMQR